LTKILGAVGIIAILSSGYGIKEADNFKNNTKLSQSKKIVIKNTNSIEKQSICFIQNGIKDNNCIMSIEAEGVGVAPCDGICSKAKAVAMARRAAIVSAYRNLAEKLYGIKIIGRDSVKNMVLQSSYVKSYVSGVIRGAMIEEENFKNGIYTVTLSLKLNPNRWNKVLKEAGLL